MRSLIRTLSTAMTRQARQCMLASFLSQNPPADEGFLGHGELEKALYAECWSGQGILNSLEHLRLPVCSYKVCLANSKAQEQNPTHASLFKVRSLQQCLVSRPHPHLIWSPAFPFPGSSLSPSSPQSPDTDDRWKWASGSRPGHSWPGTRCPQRHRNARQSSCRALMEPFCIQAISWLF